MNNVAAFDPVWDDIYGEGRHLNLYPFDMIVSYIFRQYPRHKPRDQVSILEVGCGAGNNLWFAAREGFSVCGIDASEFAIAFAKHRFKQEGLSGDLRVGRFPHLPFEENSVDLAFDRGAIVCCDMTTAKETVAEIRRTLRPGGTFLFNPYSSRHSSRNAGITSDDGITRNIAAGTLIGIGQVCFYSRDDIDRIFSTGWNVLSLTHRENVEHLDSHSSIHADWVVVAEKTTKS